MENTRSGKKKRKTKIADYRLMLKTNKKNYM